MNKNIYILIICFLAEIFVPFESHAQEKITIIVRGVIFSSSGTYHLPSFGGILNINAYFEFPLEPDEDEGTRYEQINGYLAEEGWDSILYIQEGYDSEPGTMTLQFEENTDTTPKTYYVKAAGISNVITVHIEGNVPPIEPDPVPIPEPDLKLGIAGNWIMALSCTQNDKTGYRDITFYDGLGYPSQNIQVAAGAQSGKNIVTPIVYDNMRRSDAKTYLPYPAATAGLLHETDPLSAQNAYYTSQFNNTEAQYAFSEKVYQPSPLNRVTQEFTPGNAYRSAGKYTGFSYEANTQNEVIMFTCSDNGNISAGIYPPGTLWKNSRTNEDGTVTITFTDKNNLTVLSRISAPGIPDRDTYYVYDTRLLLRWVIPPQAAAQIAAGQSLPPSSDLALKYCFRYNYDGHNNLIEKYLPGAEPQYMIYDKAGRLILYQDAALRLNQEQWIYIVYDNLGRITDKNLISSSRTWEQLIPLREYYAASYNNIYNYASSQEDLLPAYSPDWFTFISSLERYRYGESSFDNGTDYVPFSIPAYLEFEPSDNIVATEDVITAGASQIIYERIAVLNEHLGTSSQQYVERAFFYNYRREIIQTVEKNRYGGISRNSIKYDFAGNATTIQETGQIASDATVHTLTSNTVYSERGLPLSRSFTLSNPGDPTVSASVTYTYNDLGQITAKTYGNGIFQNLFYNIQGWNVALEAKNSAGNNIFSTKLYYYDPPFNATPSYTGNITAWEWQQGTFPKSTYTFEYDKTGQMKNSLRYAANNTASVKSFTEQDIEYDKNGNITTLKRYAENSAVPTADFNYSYDGNKLSAISGTASATFTYDPNGNMTHDGLKNLDITYNLLNLPQTVSQNGTLLARYIYLADGTKVAVTDLAGNGFEYLGSLTYTLAANIPSLESAAFTDGRFLAGSNSTTSQYYIADHLGSIRAITASDGTVLARNDYYPFGERHTTGNSYPTATSNRYLYNGKEKQTTGNVGFLDYGARMYNPVIARWNNTDVLAEQRYGWSPYNYVINNPINRIDQNGMLDDDYFNQHGQYLFSDNKKTDYIRIIHTQEYQKVDAIATERLITPIENTTLSDDAITNIVKYYDNKLGQVEGKSEGIEIITVKLDKTSILMVAGRTTEYLLGPLRIGGKETIKVNSKNNQINQYLNTGANIMNALVHEYKHIPDNRVYFPQPERELRALKAQQTHHTFEKTTIEYKSVIEDNILREQNKYKNIYGKEYKF